MLSGARSDLQDERPVSESAAQHGQDRIPVALAGLGIRLQLGFLLTPEY